MNASKKLRIAIYHDLPSGGGKRALYEWVRRLAPMGHAMDVFTLSTSDHDYCDIRPFTQAHHVYPFMRKGLLGRPFGRLNQVQYWRDLRSLERLGRSIAKDIDVGDYDLVFAHPCLLTIVPTILQFLRTPSVYYLHEPFGRGFVRPFQRPYIQLHPLHGTLDRLDPFIAFYEAWLQNLRRQNLRRATRLLANSQFTRDVIQHEYGVASEVCYLGVNTTDFSPDASVPRQGHILSVGELSPRKGFDFLIESLAQIGPSKRPVLQLACNANFQKENKFLTELAAQRGVTLDIRMNLKTPQLADAYRRAAFVVYTPVLEPFGLVPLEAMACGTAVVGVREGGVRETILHEQTGLLAERHPQEFAQAIETLLNNPAQCAEYGARGREVVVQNWVWDESARHIESMLMNSR